MLYCVGDEHGGSRDQKESYSASARRARQRQWAVAWHINVRANARSLVSHSSVPSVGGISWNPSQTSEICCARCEAARSQIPPGSL